MWSEVVEWANVTLSTSDIQDILSRMEGRIASDCNEFCDWQRSLPDGKGG